MRAKDRGGGLSGSRLFRDGALAGACVVLQAYHLGGDFGVGCDEVGIILSSICCKFGGGCIRAAGGLGIGWHTGGADVHALNTSIEVSNKLRLGLFGIADCLLILGIDGIAYRAGPREDRSQQGGR